MNLHEEMLAFERAQQARHDADWARLECQRLQREREAISGRLENWAWLALLAAVGALLLPGCATISAWLSPPISCDRLTLTAERDPGTSLPVVAARCGSRLVWREVCRSPDVSQGWLYCGGAKAVAIAGDVTRSGAK